MNLESSPAKRKRKRDLFRWYLVIPCLAFLTYFAILPTVFLWIVSFQHYEIVIPDMPARWRGLHNYVAILTSDSFWNAAKVTVWMALVAPIIQLIIGLGIALVLYRRTNRLITSILLIPMMIPPAAVGFNFRTLYDVRYGPLNFFITLVGLPRINWLGSVAWALPSIIIAETWQWTPFMMILLLAGLHAFPQGVYEVASLYSKSKLHIFFHITLPLLRPFLFLALILRCIDAFKLMDIVWVTTWGGPGTSTENLSFLTFRTGLRNFQVGPAAAMSIIQLAMLLLIANLLVRPMIVARHR